MPGERHRVLRIDQVLHTDQIDRFLRTVGGELVFSADGSRLKTNRGMWRRFQHAVAANEYEAIGYIYSMMVSTTSRNTLMLFYILKAANCVASNGKGKFGD